MPPKKDRFKEYDVRIKQATSILSIISEDNTTPRNIRHVAKEAKDILAVSSQTQAVRAAQAITILDEISQDTNMPAYTRTRIWNVVSILAVLKE